MLTNIHSLCLTHDLRTLHNSEHFKTHKDVSVVYLFPFKYWEQRCMSVPPLKENMVHIQCNKVVVGRYTVIQAHTFRCQI